MARRPIRTVLFDLDGALADAAPDLAFALDNLLKGHSRTPLPHETVHAEASHGTRRLIKRGFGIAHDEPEFSALRARFLKIYAENVCTHTRLFPGVAELLADLEREDLRLGIVTNKPAFLTDCLVKRLDLDSRAACIVSGDTAAHSNPHPEPLLFACAKTGGRTDECVYMGDAERDIEANRRAGMKTLMAMFGYLRRADTPQPGGADSAVRSPDEILPWVVAYA